MAKETVNKNDYVVFDKVQKIYKTGEIEVEALKNISFSVKQGELVIIVGASGSGKTTLLNILGGMDTLTSGQVTIDGVDISAMNQKQLTKFRRHDTGFVFQFYNLIQNLTAKENIQLATEICKEPFDAVEMLKSVGLEERKDNFPGQLSGGEQQRVAIARALAKNPKILLCDEPTGALDYKTGKQILQLLQNQAKKSGKTVFIITHNTAITPMGDRVITIKSGEVVDIKENKKPTPVKDIEW